MVSRTKAVQNLHQYVGVDFQNSDMMTCVVVESEAGDVVWRK